MNSKNPRILYTDASTKAIAGVDANSRGKGEALRFCVSHAIRKQRDGGMELELFAFVYCLKNLA